MNKAILICLVIGLLYPFSIQAADAIITGSLVDSSTAEPVPYATIKVEGTRLGAVSDSTGSFGLQVRPGKHNLIITRIGFNPVSLKVEVSPGEKQQVDIFMTESTIPGKGVVVTGTRTPRYMKDVPVHTEVITNSEIKAKSAHNIYDALKGISGLRVEQQCQACNFSVLRMQGLGANHTQILLDGQPVYSGLASVYGLQQLSVADVDRIEIVKGAGSALFGSNAIAGAVNIISHVPSKTEGHVGVEFGEHGTNKYELTAGTRQDNIALFLYAQQSRGDEIDETSDGYSRAEVYNSDGITDRVRTNSKSAGFNFTVEEIGSLDRLTVRGRIMNDYRLGGEIINDQFENIFAPGTERIITDRYSLQFDYFKAFSNGPEVDISANYVKHDRNATNDTYRGDYESIHGSAPPVDELRPYLAYENLFTSNMNLMLPIHSDHRLLFGTQYSYNELDESGKYIVVDDENPDYGTSYTSTSSKSAHKIGIYFQDEYTLTPDLEAVAGARLDYHSSEDGFRGSGDLSVTDFDPIEYEETAVNPRISVRYSASDEITVRASFGTGFRVPYGFSEDLHLCSGSPRVYKDLSLEPEKSRSFGLSLDYQSPKLGVNLNLYRTDLMDRIDFSEADEDIEALGYTYQWKNIDDGFTMGIEIGANVAPVEHLVLSAGFEFNKSEYDNPREDWIGTKWESESKRFSRYPATSGTFKIEYDRLGWNLAMDASYKGRMYIDLLEPADENDIKIKQTESFVLLNAKVSKMLFDRYKAYLGVKNLGDYIQKEKHVDDATFMYAPVYGRLIYGGFEVNFGSL